ncbi:MAG: PatB family C-S lyase, partial [Acidobacteria bacterium]|nr:PatB family C-S lyase [Acidobacteriota bacterium]
MHHSFDRSIARRHSDSTKWHVYDEDVLPLWTADMDFAVPDPVIAALHARVDHGVFGYCIEPPELREVIVDRLDRLYGWRVAPEAILLDIGVLQAFRHVAAITASRDHGVLVQPPVYPPMFGTAKHNGSIHQEAPLVRRPDGRYEIDFDAFEAAITGDTRIFILCNPHNPVGRVFRRDELERMAQICLRHDVLICSDEIHCDLVYPGARHIPIASLDPDIAHRTVTLMAPSKTFNIPGLRCSFAIVTDPELRPRLDVGYGGDFAEVNNLGLVAALAAYRGGQPWLDDVLAYLQANRDFVVDFVRRELPGVRTVAPDATYLAWLDCRESRAADDPYQFFLDRARVALSPGPSFGTGGNGFVRLNFGCTRATL